MVTRGSQGRKLVPPGKPRLRKAVEHDNEWGIILALFGDVEFDTVAGDTTVSNVRKVAGNSHDRYAVKNSVRIIEG